MSTAPITVRTFQLNTANNLRFEVDVPAVGVSFGSGSAGSFVFLNSEGLIDSSLLPTITTLLLETNGTANQDQTLLNLIAGSNISLTAGPSGGVTISATGTVSVAFNNISSGTNTLAAMVIGSGASLTTTGTGTIEATELATSGAPVVTNTNAPSHAGQLLISQPGNTTAVWADPQVQGLYAAGSSIASPPAYAPPTTIQPILIGAADPSGNLQNLNEDVHGNLFVTDTVAENYLSTLVGTVTNAGSPAQSSVRVDVVNGTVSVSGSVSVSNIPTPLLFFTAQALNQGNTAVWTPTSGKKFQLMRFFIEVTANAALGSAGILTMQFYDGSSTAIPIAFDFWLPEGSSSSGNTDGFQTNWVDLGQGITSAAVNNVLNINLSGTIAEMSPDNQGNVRVVVCGVEV